MKILVFEICVNLKIKFIFGNAILRISFQEIFICISCCFIAFYNLKIKLSFNYSIEPIKAFISFYQSLMNICWIFDKNSRYQVLISLGSIIKSNPIQNFIFYFIIPPNGFTSFA